jgi:predicted permease
MNIWHDLLYSLRLCIKKPVFSALCILTLALGICSVVVITTIIYPVALKPISFGGGDELLTISQEDNLEYQGWSRLDGYSYNFFRANSSTLNILGAASTGDLTIHYQGEVQHLQAAAVTPGLLDQIGVQPVLGRLMGESDIAERDGSVILLAYSLWQNFFAGDPDIINKRVTIMGEPQTVIGVMPEGFKFPLFADVWRPLDIGENLQPGELASLQPVTATLKEGASLELANRELGALWQRLNEEFPETYVDSQRAVVIPYTLIVTGQSVLDLLTVTVAIILLITLYCCLNVGNLLLVQISERAAEISIRTALGAPRWWVLRQVLMESLILCLAGAGLALVFSYYVLQLVAINFELFSWAIFGGMPFWWNIELNSLSITSALVTLLFLWIACSFYPVWKMSKQDYNAALNVGGGKQLLPEAKRTSNALLVVQISFASVLLISTAALVLVINTTARADSGIATENYISGVVAMDSMRQYSVTEVEEFQNDLREELLAQAELSAITYSTAPGQCCLRVGYDFPSSSLMNSGEHPTVEITRIDTHYLNTMDIPVLRGRDFLNTDTRDTEPVAIVDSKFAEIHWPNESPIGKRIQLYRGENLQTVTVVGQIPNIVQSVVWPNIEANAYLYRPLAQRNLAISTFNVIARVEGLNSRSLEQSRKAITRAAMLAFNEGVKNHNNLSTVNFIRPLPTVVQASNAEFRWVGDMYLLISLATLVLTASGIFAIYSRTTFQRNRELGVRRAVGSSNFGIVKLLLNEKLIYIAPSFIFAAGCSVLAVNQLTEYMPSILHYLPLAMLLTLFAIVTTVFLSSLIPASYFLKMEPGEALHYD